VSWLAKLRGRLPSSTRQWIRRIRRPRLGHLPFARLNPISRQFGYDRGQPIDRYFIERFLNESSALIRGDCLEVRDSSYTRQFGGNNVGRIDVLDISPDNAAATIHGDLRRLHGVADDTYDCIILTQVLQYIDDLPSAVAETFRILKPGGTVLVTVPFMMPLDDQHAVDFWRLTPNSASYLLGKHFPKDNIKIKSWGCLASSTAFWMGMAQEDLSRKHLARSDPKYSCTLSIRATKPASSRVHAAD
jgi:hypothetical protein